MVVRSSVQAEFRAIAHGISKLLWLKLLLEELQATLKLPLKIYSDYKVGISIAHNPVSHDRTKHVEVGRYFIKEKIEERVICMSYVPTTEQAVDILTKGLPRPCLRN